MTGTQDGELSLVGLGLGPSSISLEGLELAQGAEHVFLEAYTALAPQPIDELETLVGQPVEALDRAAVEDGTRLLVAAQDGGCCLLVAGDPLSATTHTALRMQAAERGVEVRIAFAASILTAAAGLLGLSHYKFGRTTTLVTPQPGYFPESPYDAIAANLEAGLHSLVLLDIREDGTCMLASEAAHVLLELEARKGGDHLDQGTRACVVARAGQADARTFTGTLAEIAELDAGEPMHTLVLPGELSPFEVEALEALTEPAAPPT